MKNAVVDRMKIRDRIIEFRRVPAAELQPDPRNWRLHPKAQADALRGVLAEIGYAGAALARKTPEGGLMLVDGHLRAETDPAGMIPTLILDVTDEEAAKLLATMDPLSAMAKADKSKLDALLREVNTGSEALQAMLAELAKDAGIGAPEVVEDEVPEPPVEPVSRTGDLWLLGEHRVLCGDSTKAEDVARLLGERSPFIMVTDPPYGVEYDPEWRTEAAAKGLIGFSTARVGIVQNDERVDWTEAYKLFPGHVAYVWHAGRFAADLVVNLRDAGFGIRTQIIWKKPSFAISRGHYHWQHEPAWYDVRNGGSAKWCGDRSQSTIWEIKVSGMRGHESGDQTNHGTQKPVECMARPIRNHGDRDDDVYDPFLGSGTTIIAAQQLNRRAFGLEIDPRYTDVICERFRKLTGVPAILEEGRKAWDDVKAEREKALQAKVTNASRQTRKEKRRATAVK